MEEIIARIKGNRLAQIALILIIVVIILAFYNLSKLARKPKRQLPCYNQKVRILSPFSRDKFFKIEKIFRMYCLTLEVDTKPIEYIKANLLKEIAEGKIPDLVYVDNNFIAENKNIFKEYDGDKILAKDFPETAVFLRNNKLINYPLAFDVLVLFANKKYLDILGIITPPDNFEDLVQLISIIKRNPQISNINPIALGTANNIDNFYEIFTTIYKNYTTPNYRNIDNFFKALDFYTQFADLKNPLYSWSDSKNNSLEEFGRGNLVFAFGFYSDIEKIKEINPKLKFQAYPFPKFKNKIEQTNFMRVYSFGAPKQGKYKFAWKALEIINENYGDFIKDFDLLPTRKDVYDRLEEEKKAIAKDLLIGSGFDEFNREYGEQLLKDAVNKWLVDREIVKTQLIRGQFSKLFRK